ncbi:putative quinone oxidoreductase [Aspergillus campestris IBT 28561]|uniref:Quinone oxidoreductase n=1 Tax=Aspergillus campestris (strain IBT 28561) TaxID=1392248 RepID=A0A2I1D415_ASPC2|nr:putative quinone oxidoreductase [Aspergillus campestris IBT 28561]PKY04614.1 putative quinone oxidoreductase [Aspergillus campestris IBT 28561]
MTSIPTTQQAALVENPGPAAKIVHRDDIPVATPGPNEILVKLTCTGLCHSEIRAVLGWGPYNAIVAHEGIGTVVQTGLDVSPSMMHQRVGIKWLYSACGKCSVCARGFPNNCPHQLNTGRHVPGTLQQYVVADARYVSAIPDGLSDEVAAPLLCAGLSMAGALSKLDGEVQAGDWVVISGSGGGLGHIGVQIAARIRGFRVIAIDRGDAKRALSLQSGAEVFLDYEEDDLVRRVAEITGEGAHAILVVPGTEAAFQVAPSLVRNLASIVCVGLPPNQFNLPISATACAARGLVIKGACVGTDAQMDELLRQALAGKLTPLVEVLEFSETARVIEGLKTDTITGRVVVKIPQ